MHHRVVTILGSYIRAPLLTNVPVRHWNYNRRKLPFKFIDPVVPLDKLKLEEPVSASLEFEEDMGRVRKFEWNAESMNSRGFLRFQKEYIPPSNVKERILEISVNVIPELAKLKKDQLLNYDLGNKKTKFELLSKASSQLQHSVPNSMLYMIRNVGDVINFYCTEIKTTTPFDELVRNQNDLPPNLHIQQKAIRFHPDTDTHFKGMTAFPKSSTLVTGLRSKNKYKGYEAKKSWP